MGKLSIKEKVLILKWLLNNTPKKLVDVHTPKTPIQDSMIICWYPTQHSGRSLYERKYIENVRGKPCSYCGTPLNGRNTHIRVTFSPIKIREEVWCTHCINMDAGDKTMVRKAGFEKMTEVKLIKDEILVLREKLGRARKTRTKYKEAYTIFKSRNYYLRETLSYAKEVENINSRMDELDRRINSIKSEIEQSKTKINKILKNTSFERPTYIIDYDEIVPFRSEDDFDF